MRKEPVLTRAAVAAFVTAALTLANALGIELPFGSEKLTDALYGVLIIGAFGWSALSSRRKVTPVGAIEAGGAHRADK